MPPSISDFIIPFSGTISFNSVNLGALSREIKLRLKFKDIKFGNTQSDHGLAKLVKFAQDVEVEFDSDNATIANLQKAIAGLGTLASSTLTLAANARISPTPYTLAIALSTKNAGGGKDEERITITNMVCSAETLELLLSKDKNIKVPMKFVSTSGWSLAITEYVSGT